MRAAGGIFKGAGRNGLEWRSFASAHQRVQLHPQFLAGFRSCLPVLPGVLAFGSITGVAMVAAGMPYYLAVLMSLLVFAGNAQLAALQLVTSGSPIAIAILARKLAGRSKMPQ